MFLSLAEHKPFEITKQYLKYSNLFKEEWTTIRSLADDRSVVIKRSENGSCVVVWDRNVYVFEAKKKLSVYRDVSNSKNILHKLSEARDKMFISLRKKGVITEKQIKYFTYEYKKATNFSKLYFLYKILKRLFEVPGRPVISNCGTPTDKWSEFFDHHLKKVTKKGWSYVKESGDFIKEINNLVSIPENAILVTADMVGLYPSVTHEVVLRALREALDKKDERPFVQKNY